MMLYLPFKDLRLSVRPSICQRFVSTLYLEHFMTIFFFKLCIRVDIRKEWFGIVDVKISSIKSRVMDLD